MSQIENPPAFPSVCLGDPEHPASRPGMDLRDWFAGQAVIGFMVASSGRSGHYDENDVAQNAYVIADALLATRQLGRPE